MKGQLGMPEFLSRDEWVKRVVACDKDAPLLDIGLRKFGSFDVLERDIDPTTGMMDITFVISTGVQDRDDDVIAVEGWEVENYLKNPVVLWAHDYTRLPVAAAQDVSIKDGKLIAVDRFTPQEMNPFGHMVYQMVRGKFLRATSVGFRPLTYVFNDEHKGYDFSTQELMEHSIVPVPSNPEALVAASASGIDLAPMKEWAEAILDRDPTGDKVALWLPKGVVEEVHRSLSEVTVSLIDTSTPQPDAKAEEDPPDTTFEDGTEDVVKSTVGELISEIKDQDEREERLMKEAIKALTEIVRELRGVVSELPEKIAAKLDEVTEKIEAVSLPIVDAEKVKAEADAAAEKAKAEAEEKGEQLTADEVKTIVREATIAAFVARTGRLPK